MEIPGLNNPIWKDLVTGEKLIDFNFLAIKIFLGRARLLLGNDSSEANIQKLSNELREIFVKHANISVLQKDIELLQK